MAKKLNNSGSGLLSLLFAVMIIGLIYYFAMGGKKGLESSNDSYLKQMSVDATSYNSMLQSAQKIVDSGRPKPGQNE